MRRLKIIGLSIAIWGASLLWPDINLLLSARLMMGLGLGFSIILMIHNLWRHFHRVQQRFRKSGSNHPTQPLPPIALAH